MATKIGGIVLLIAAFASVSVHAQVEPADSATEYPYHCQIGGHQIGADYLARQLPAPTGLYSLADILVIEVGVFPETDQTIQVGSSNVELIVNDASFGTALTDGSFVAAMLRHPEWTIESRPRLVGGVSAGSGTVIIGPQHRGGRFPGDPRTEGDYPRPVPQPLPRPSGSEASSDDLAYIAVAHELPRHLLDRPTAGYVYFHEKMPLRKIKKLELRVHLDAGECVLAIDPRQISDPVNQERREQPKVTVPGNDGPPSPDRPRAPRYVSRVLDKPQE